jgi:hypothetical protein
MLGAKRVTKCCLVIWKPDKEVDIEKPEPVRLAPHRQLVNLDIPIPDLRKAGVLAKDSFIENEPNRLGSDVWEEFCFSESPMDCKRF